MDHSETVELVARIDRRLHQRAAEVLGADWWNTWRTGLPRWESTPGQVNLPIILMLWNLAKAFDMVDYGKMRYNLLGNGGHWFPGAQLGDTDPASLEDVLSGSPHRDRVIEAVAEAHEMLKGQDVQRLQEDE
jgi:hypothetical protein